MMRDVGNGWQWLGEVLRVRKWLEILGEFRSSLLRLGKDECVGFC